MHSGQNSPANQRHQNPVRQEHHVQQFALLLGHKHFCEITFSCEVNSTHNVCYLFPFSPFLEVVFSPAELSKKELNVWEEGGSLYTSIVSQVQLSPGEEEKVRKRVHSAHLQVTVLNRASLWRYQDRKPTSSTIHYILDNSQWQMTTDSIVPNKCKGTVYTHSIF